MTLVFEGEMAKNLEKWYATADVKKQRDFVCKYVSPKEGEHILDIGSGPGMLAQSLAPSLGATGLLVGIDISESMVNSASERCKEFPNLHFQLGDACDLKHPDGKLFDCIISTQVYEYVSDIPKAFEEAYKILKPGGRFIILDTDFDSTVWHSSNRNQMAKMLKAYDEHLIHPHLPQSMIPFLKQAGFEDITTRVFCICNTTLADTYSFGLMSTIGDYVVGRQGITAEHAKEWKDDLISLDNKGEYFFSLNRYLFVANKN